MQFIFIPRIVIGAILLLLGRRLFWLFVAGAGFVFAFRLAAGMLVTQPDWIHLALAVVAGVIGGFLAVGLQWLAIGVGGFLGGGHLAARLLEMLGIAHGQPEIVVFLVGGVIGVVVIVALFDPALVLLSSMLGAAMIVDGLDLGPTLPVVVWVALTIVGVMVQRRFLEKARIDSR